MTRANSDLDLSPFTGASLCVVGNVNRDLRLGAIAPAERLFQDGETPTSSIHETIGGGGANSALAAAKLGANASFIGKIGDDSLGQRLDRTLAARGVQTRLARDSRVATGTSVNLVWTSGHRHFVSCLPNATSLTFGDLDLSMMKGQKHLLRADVWFSDQMLFGDGNRKLFEAAKNAGIVISLDVNADPWAHNADANALAERRSALRKVLPLVDVVHGNVAELCAFMATSGLVDALQSIEQSGVGAVVVHLGAVGAGFYRDGNLITESAARLASAPFQTTGTGDMLSVCMMLLHTRNDPDVHEKLRLSNQIVSRYITGQLPMGAELVD